MKFLRINFTTNLFVTLVILLIIFPINDIFSSNAKFYSVNTIYGKSIRDVYSICKDDEGFIWGASKTGILRVSENDCRLYSLPVTITDFYFTRLGYRDSALIAYTSNGQVFIYNKLYDRFDLLVDIRQTLNDVYINAIGLVADKNETLWIGTTKGLFKYSNKQLTLVYDSKKEVQYISLYDEHNMIIATVNGIGIFDLKSSKLTHGYKYSTENEIQVSSLLSDPELNQIWIGTISNGLFRYSLKEKELIPVLKGKLSKQPILTIKNKNVQRGRKRPIFASRRWCL